MEKPYLQQLSQRALQTLHSLENKCFRNRTFALDFISKIFNYVFFNHFFYQNNTNTPSNFLHVPHVLILKFSYYCVLYQNISLKNSLSIN